MGTRPRQSRRQLTGAILLGVLILLAVFAPLLTDASPAETSRATRLPPGSPGHLLGTDLLGRDTLARVLYGGRTSLAVGTAAGALALVVGVVVGALAGMGGRKTDAMILWLIDSLLALPAMVLLIAVQSTVPRGVLTVVLVIGLLSWMSIARIVRAQCLTLRTEEFVLGAHALGGSPFRVATRHVLPNALGAVRTLAAPLVAGAILTETSLSFLQLGVPGSTPTWGNILSDTGRSLSIGTWWVFLAPIAAIGCTVVAVHLLVEGHVDER